MKYWFLWLLLGILAIVAGIFAIANPFAASITATQLVGWSLLFYGILQALVVFYAQGWGRKIWVVVLGVLTGLAGFWLLANPLAGTISLTLALAFLLLGTGAAKIFGAFTIKGTKLFWLVLASGAVSIILAVMILANFPASAVSILGLLLGIELISSGVSTITLALVGRRLGKAFA